ncbi:MAG: cobalamin-independent methionine synthase II family protein, partial [Candidatus Caldarchaeum sp.]
EVESVETIVRKAEEAVKYFDPDKIFLNPDCGFGTFAESPVNTPRTAFRKLKTMAEDAQILRKRYG